MANKLYEENDIQAIANAIRGKNGSTDTYKVSEMATAIEGIPSGGTLEDFIPEEAFHISGNCSYRFANGMYDWLLERYGDRMASFDITDSTRMFFGSNITQIPFDFNFADGGCNVIYMLNSCRKVKSIKAIDFKQTSVKDCNNLFGYSHNIEQIGKLSNLFPSYMNSVFHSTHKLRYLPEFEGLNLSYIQTNASSRCQSLFANDYSLREIPEDFLKQLYVSHSNVNYVQFREMFMYNYALDEIVGLNPQTGTLTSNAFVNTFDLDSRVKDIIFAIQENGTPYSVNWKSQTINFTSNVGYANSLNKIIDYNSGITMDKRVTDDSSYQALKNDPDWFTTDINYSRYNHDSAVNTINSLPDTSAYLASAGGTNTIKFKGESGKLTDGRAINTLTEAEIAVATAKGWTVTFA